MSSLPDDIALSILARISCSYYPKLSLVSKNFRSIILSPELHKESHLGTLERCLYVCLQSIEHPYDRSWFNIKPDDDHQALRYSTAKDKTTANWLPPMSYSLSLSSPTIGSETYEFRGGHTPLSSSDLWVYNELTDERCESRSVARKTVDMYEITMIDNLCYRCDGKECYWFDSGCAKWKLVKGLSGLDQHFTIDTVIGGYCGKLVLVWIGPAMYPLFHRWQIWRAVILLEKPHDGEIWGQIESIDRVLTAPIGKYTLGHCIEVLQ